MGNNLNSFRFSSSVCRVWTDINNPSFTYPELEECSELKNKPNFGIALSGGGCRALSMSIGTLRELHKIGVLKKSRYISTNSGSSWLNGPFSYSKNDITEFLGEYLPPNKCDLKTLKEIDLNSHAYTVCNGRNLDTFLKRYRDHYLTTDRDPRSFWSEAVGEIFFKPYNLNEFDHLPAVAGSNKTFIHKETGFPLQKIDECDLNRNPFPIINGSIVVRGNRMTAPLEFTPLYYGVPGRFHYHAGADGYKGGGYLIEPFGFTSIPSEQQRVKIKNLLENSSNTSPNFQAKTIEVSPPSIVISVSDQAGVSSSAITEVAAQAVSTKAARKLDFTVYPIWNPLTSEVHDMTLADGLGGDNTAIHSLLRRKVRKICAMFAINVSIMEQVDHRNMSQSGFADVAALFGVMTADKKTLDGVTAEEYNKFRQVFPSEDFDKLLQGLKNRYIEGKPCTFILRTRALPNTHIGVPGGHPVDLLMVICAPTDNWVNSLPESTKKRVLEARSEVDNALKNQADDDQETEASILERIGKSISGMKNRVVHDISEVRDNLRVSLQKSKLRDFPFTKTQSFDYTVQLVNLITNLMCWEVVESEDLFEELLRDD